MQISLFQTQPLDSRIEPTIHPMHCGNMSHALQA